MSLTPTNTFSVTSSTAGQTLTTPSFTPATNDIIVVKGIIEDSTYTLNTPTATGGGITWTLRVSDNTSSHVHAYLWTGVVTSGGSSITVSVAPGASGGPGHSIEVEQWPGASCQLAASPATAKTVGSSGAATTTITTAANGSAVSWLDGDWNAVAPGTPTLASSATLESDPNVNGSYTGYYAYQQAATAGSQTFGVTSPTGQAYTLLAIEIQASSSGTNYSKSQSDTEKLTDSASATQNMQRSKSDAEKLTDSVALIRSTTHADAEKLTDAASVTQSMVRPQSDLEKLTDSATVTQSLQRSPSDTERLTDSVATTQHLQRQVSDTERLTDSATATQGITRPQADTERLTDTASATQSMVRAQGDTLKMTDSVTVTFSGGTTYDKTPSDTLKMTDSVTVIRTIERTVSDTLKLTDSAPTTQQIERTHSDSLHMTDTASSSTEYVRQIFDTEKLSDAASKTQDMSRSVDDTLRITDTESTTQAIVRVILDALRLTDTATTTDLSNLKISIWRVFGMIRRWHVLDVARRWQASAMTRRWGVTALSDTYQVGTIEYVPLPITLNGTAITNVNVTAANASVVPFGNGYGTFGTSCVWIDGYWCVPTTGLALGKYSVYVRLTTTTGETPILYCGTISMVNAA